MVDIYDGDDSLTSFQAMYLQDWVYEGDVTLTVYQPGDRGQALTQARISVPEATIHTMGGAAWSALANKLDRRLLTQHGSVHHDRLWVWGRGDEATPGASLRVNGRRIPTYFMGGPWSGTWDNTVGRQTSVLALTEELAARYKLWHVKDFRIAVCYGLDFYGSDHGLMQQQQIVPESPFVASSGGFGQSGMYVALYEKGYGGGSGYKLTDLNDS